MIGLYDNVVNSINTLDNMEQDDTEWYDVVDLSSIDIPNYFVDGGKSNSDILHEEDEHDDIPFETCTVDDSTIGMENVTCLSADQMRFYDCPRAQIDGGAKCSVTNILDILHDINFYDEKFKPPVKMKGATSEEIIVPEAEGYLRVQADVPAGFIDVRCYRDLTI